MINLDPHMLTIIAYFSDEGARLQPTHTSADLPPLDRAGCKKAGLD